MLVERTVERKRGEFLDKGNRAKVMDENSKQQKPELSESESSKKKEPYDWMIARRDKGHDNY